MENKIRSDRKYWIFFLVTALLLTVIIRYHVRNLSQEIRHEGISSAVSSATKAVLIDMVDVETGLRGYLIAGRRDFLRPYHEGLGRFVYDLASLRAGASKDPFEVVHVDQIETLARSIFTEFANQIARVDADGVQAARKRFVDFPTKPSMDLVRDHVTSIQAEESRRMAINREVLERAMTTALTLLDVFLVVIVLILVAMLSGFIALPRPLSKPIEAS